MTFVQLVITVPKLAEHQYHVPKEHILSHVILQQKQNVNHALLLIIAQTLEWLMESINNINVRKNIIVLEEIAIQQSCVLLVLGVTMDLLLLSHVQQVLIKI